MVWRATEKVNELVINCYNHYQTCHAEIGWGLAVIGFGLTAIALAIVVSSAIRSRVLPAQHRLDPYVNSKNNTAVE